MRESRLAPDIHTVLTDDANFPHLRAEMLSQAAKQGEQSHKSGN